jgi:hypothetical protein
MKTFVRFNDGETVNVEHIVKFTQYEDDNDNARIEILLSDGTTRILKDTETMNRFTNGLVDRTFSCE